MQPSVTWPVVAGLVVVLSAVQSVFGVGLLVFGTPALLLLGLPFSQVLAYLLPCSIMVSGLQVATTGGVRLDPMRRQFLVFAAPAVVLATIATLRWGSPGRIRLVVGVMLILSALLRAAGPAQRRVRAYVRRHQRPLFLVLGLVHGVSNLGGGLLTAVVGASFEGKAAIRRQIAFCYGLLALLQLFVVLLTNESGAWGMSLLLPLLAAGTYLLVGQRVFRRAGQSGYERALTAMILGVGVVLVAS